MIQFIKKYAIVLGLFIPLVSCNAKGKNNKKQTTIKAPTTYNVSSPKIINMPEELLEISGIAFLPGDDNTLLAEQDELGNVYSFNPNQPAHPNVVNFGKQGDYEDIAVNNKTIFLLRSDGSIYTFPIEEWKTKTLTNIKIYKSFLPKAEYEGIFYKSDENALYALTKSNRKEEKLGQGSVYKMAISSDGTLQTPQPIVFDVKAINNILGVHVNTAFRPSALAYNQQDKQWYFLSSINKSIVLLDAQFKPINAYPLDRSIYPQPEGINFDTKGNLWLSSEGVGGKPGMVYYIQRQLQKHYP